MSLIQRIFSKSDSSSIVPAAGAHPVTQLTLPNETSGIADHILAHPRGEKFEYVVVGDSALEERASLLQRVINKRPSSSPTPMDVDVIPAIPLNRPITELWLERTITGKKVKAYVRLVEMFIYYVPLTSPYDPASMIRCKLIDKRKKHQKVQPMTEFQGNKGYDGRMMLDYYVHKEDLHDLVFLLEYDDPALEPGKYWGTVKLQLNMEHVDFPHIKDTEDNVGRLVLPQSMVKPRSKNPYALFMGADDDDMRAMEIMYARGEITDISVPVSTIPKQITYAGTSFAGAALAAAGSDNPSIINDIASNHSSNRMAQWAQGVAEHTASQYVSNNENNPFNINKLNAGGEQPAQVKKVVTFAATDSTGKVVELPDELQKTAADPAPGPSAETIAVIIPESNPIKMTSGL